MKSGHLLAHGCEKALGVEESCDPEHLWSPMENPLLELGVPLQQLSEPEPQGGGMPRWFLPILWHSR